MRKWLLLVVMAMVSTGLLASCGRQEPVGSLRVVSEPAGAAIRLDGVETGDATPADLLLPVGQHTVAVNRSGYLITPAQRTLNVPAGRQVLASFALAELGELTVTSAPAGADIVLDGDASGEVTPHTFSLVIGPHTVAVALADHVAEGGGTTIDLQSGVPHTVEFTMLPAGTLTVTSTPADARILIDDTDTGEMTPATVTLAVGDYAVRVEKDGYVSDPASRDVSIAAGAGEFADFTLTSTGALGSLSVTSVPSGAAISLVSSPWQIGMVRDTHRDLTVTELVEHFMDGVDVVLTEDYHRERWPKVEVHRRATGKPLRCAGDETLVALVSDEALPVDIPIFGFDQISDVARLLLERDGGASPDGPRD